MISTLGDDIEMGRYDNKLSSNNKLTSALNCVYHVSVRLSLQKMNLKIVLLALP